MESSPLWLRAASLVVLVVLFQVCIARVPSVQRETKRRWQHALTGHVLVQSSYVLPKNVALALLIITSVGMLLWRTFLPEHFYQAFGPLLRPTELQGGSQYMPGAFYFLLGTAITVSMVDGWMIPRYAVECLALADPVASWIGSSILSPKINAGTSLSGAIACFVTAMGVGWCMLEEPYNNMLTLMIGALACTIAEGLPFGNDNLNIPILTALAITALADGNRDVETLET
jgi:dolichol kinase